MTDLLKRAGLTLADLKGYQMPEKLFDELIELSEAIESEDPPFLTMSGALVYAANLGYMYGWHEGFRDAPFDD